MGLVIGVLKVISSSIIGCKRSVARCNGSQGITFGANIKISILEGSWTRWESYANSFIPIGFHPIIHLLMSIGSKLVFNHLPRSSYLHICTTFSFIFPSGHLTCVWIAHTRGPYHMHMVGCSKTPKD